MKNQIISFDLKAPKSGDYSKAAIALRALGFHPRTPGIGSVELPSTTVVGSTNLTAAALRDTIRARFSAVGLNPSAVFVADFDDWAAIGNRVTNAA